MHKRKVLYFREPQVHTILLRQLSQKGYQIYPKVRLADAINLDRGEYLPQREFRYLCGAHLDFLVVQQDSPVFAVEFDGVDHLHDPATIERDVLKNRLCKAADLPLLRVTSVEITDSDQLTLLDYMLMRYVAWHTEIDEILDEIRDYAAQLPPDTDPADVVIDLDPSFHFNLRHPFPGSEIVRERLWRRYRIAWDLDSKKRQNSPSYLCDVNMKSCSPTQRDQFINCEVATSAWRPELAGHEPIFVANVSVTLRSWLPLRVEVPEPEIELFGLGDPRKLEEAVERFKLRVESMWFPKLPGISIWGISESYAEYLGFRAIEKWAKTGLKSVL
jgi:hypothetical protein